MEAEFGGFEKHIGKFPAPSRSRPLRTARSHSRAPSPGALASAARRGGGREGAHRLHGRWGGPRSAALGSQRSARCAVILPSSRPAPRSVCARTSWRFASRDLRRRRMLHMPASAQIEFYQRPWSPRQVRMLGRLVAHNLVLTEADQSELRSIFHLPAANVKMFGKGTISRDFARKIAIRSAACPRSRSGGTGGGTRRPRHRSKGAQVLDRGRRWDWQSGRSRKIRHRQQRENDQAIRAQVAELGLADRFLFAGFQRDVRPYIDACDIMVMPSLFESRPSSFWNAWPWRRRWS